MIAPFHCHFKIKKSFLQVDDVFQKQILSKGYSRYVSNRRLIDVYVIILSIIIVIVLIILAFVMTIICIFSVLGAVYIFVQFIFK